MKLAAILCFVFAMIAMTHQSRVQTCITKLKASATKIRDLSAAVSKGETKGMSALHENKNLLMNTVKTCFELTESVEFLKYLQTNKQEADLKCLGYINDLAFLAVHVGQAAEERDYELYYSASKEFTNTVDYVRIKECESFFK